MNGSNKQSSVRMESKTITRLSTTQAQAFGDRDGVYAKIANFLSEKDKRNIRKAGLTKKQTQTGSRRRT